MRRWLVLPILALAPPVARGRPGSPGHDHRRPSPAVRHAGSRRMRSPHARTESPTYRQALNNADPARWGVRNAYGNFLPQLSVSGGMGYSGSGESQFGTFFFQSTPAFISSNYQVGLQWRLGRARAGRAGPTEGARAGDHAGHRGRRGQPPLGRHDPVPQRAGRRRLDRGRAAAGEPQRRVPPPRARPLPGRPGDAARRAPGRGHEGHVAGRVAPGVPAGERGQARAVPADGGASRRSRFSRSRSPIRSRSPRPTYELEELLRQAEAENPSLRALKERETAARANVRAVRSDFFPRLTAQAGLVGVHPAAHRRERAP